MLRWTRSCCCSSNGLIADCALWHEASNAKNKMSAAQFAAMMNYYGPTVRRDFPLVYCEDAYAIQVNGALSYLTGVTVPIDKYTCDYYATEYWDAHTIRLDTFANAANAAVVPLGLWQFNWCSASSVAQDTTYFQYLQSFFTARVSAGLINADLLLFNDNGPDSMPYITSSSLPRAV